MPKRIFELVKELEYYREMMEFLKEEKKKVQEENKAVIDYFYNRANEKYMAVFKLLQKIAETPDGVLINYAARAKILNDIVEVASALTKLKKVGDEYRGKCPIHKEEHPSFFVSPSLQVFHCFGCGKKGDVIQLVMEVFGMDFQEAVKMLNRKEDFKKEEVNKNAK